LKAGIFSEITDVYIPRIFMFYFGFNWHITLYIFVDAVKSPGLCSLKLGLDSACDSHQSITAITLRIVEQNLNQIPTSYLMFTCKFCFPKGFNVYIHIIYLKKHFLFFLL
jgi:hypothetical protein